MEITPSSSYRVSCILSRSEEITSEVRKLVLTCRSLEAQLQQSIPKKTHLEIVGKMQGAIDSLSADLGRTKEELAKTTSLGERINALESTVASQSSMISSQNNVIGALTSKFSEALVLASTYGEAKEKIQYLEERNGSMVERSQYDALVDASHELDEKLSNSLPKEQFYILEDRLSHSVSRSAYDELEYKLSQMVPREELSLAESKVQDLERALLNSVPRQDYEVLASKISQLSTEADAAKAGAQATLEVTPPEIVTVVERVPVEAPAEVPTISGPIAAVAPVPTAEPEAIVSPIETSVINELVPEIAPSPQIDSTPIVETTQPESTITSVFDFTAPAPVPEAAPVQPEPAPVQEILVSVHNAETVVTPVESPEQTPIVESITPDQQTLDGSRIEYTTPIVGSPPASIPEVESTGQTTLNETTPEPQTFPSEAEVQPAVVDFPTPKVEPNSPTDESLTRAFDVVETTVPEEEPVHETAIIETISEPATTVAEIQDPTPEVVTAAEQAPGEAPVEVPMISAPIEVTPVSTAEPEAVVSPVETPVVNEPVPEIASSPQVDSTPIVETAQPESTITSVFDFTAPAPVPDAAPVQTEPAPAIIQAEQAVPVTEVEPIVNIPEPVANAEIREVQSQLAEINSAAEAGETTFQIAPSPLVVEFERGFRFTSTEFCARSGMEFFEDLEKVDPSIVEQHCRNGDFERWFKEVLADESTVEAIKSVRESELSGDAMRAQLVAVIATKYRK